MKVLKTVLYISEWPVCYFVVLLMGSLQRFKKDDSLERR